MIENQNPNQRIDFFEQLHQEFLYLKGYGTYAYITAHAVDQLYESFLEHQKHLSSSLNQPYSDVDFIRRFIKSL